MFSRDKAIAVIHPLKSSIWLTQKRVSYICYATSLLLLVANLPFISFATRNVTGGTLKSCGLDDKKDPLVLDIITASILPIGKTELSCFSDRLNYRKENNTTLCVCHTVMPNSSSSPQLKSKYIIKDDN